MTQISGKVASAKGSSKAGIAYLGGQIVCGQQMDLCNLEQLASEGKLAGPGVECSVAGGCSGNTGFDWSFSNSKVLDFLRLGAFFDNSSGTRSKNESWLKEAKIPTFESVEFSDVIK